MPLARMIHRDCLLSALPSPESRIRKETPCPVAGRERVEAFIRKAYMTAYDAAIEVDYPTLISAQHDDGVIRAAAGFRRADSGPLFLEQYTREPAEAVMSRLCGEPVARSRIAEVGNLASTDGSASLFLYTALAACLREHGITHAMVTVTDALHQRFLRLGLHPSKVCDASADLLVSAAEDWGSYYETQPRVLAGSLDEALERLHALPGVIRESGRPLSIRLYGETIDE
jgi:hypothetical protein